MFIVVLAITQVTFLSFFKIFGVGPDLLLIAVVMACMRFERRWALIAGLACGLLKDALATHSFGIYALLYCLWSWLILQLSRKITIDYKLMPQILIVLMVLGNSIALRALSLAAQNTMLPFGIFVRTCLLESLYTAAISPLLFRLIEPVLSIQFRLPSVLSFKRKCD